MRETTPPASLTPEQIALCIEAQRAYYRARAALETFEQAFRVFNDYGDLGRLPTFDWPRLGAAQMEAQVASETFNTLIAKLRHAGIEAYEAMLVVNPTPKSALEVAMEAHRQALRAVTALLRKQPTPQQRARAKAILEAANG